MGASLMHVHGPGVHLGVGRGRIDGAQDASGVALGNGHDGVRATQGQVVGRAIIPSPVPPVRTAPQDPSGDQGVDARTRGRPEHLEVRRGQR